MRSLVAMLALAGLFAQPEATQVAPAMKKVITMLNNLVSEIDAEAKDDEEKHATFAEWSAKEITDTGVEIERLQAVVEDLTSTLVVLNAKKDEISTQFKKVKEDISNEQSQVDMATEKRHEEASAFSAEQQDFANAISACGKAAKLLATHYGDGAEEAGPSKPDFMSLLATVQKLAAPKGHSGRALRRLSLLQGDRYTDSSGEAGDIVGQIKVLKSSFEDDKQSGIEDETKLKEMYAKLMKEKLETLTTLKAERDSLQSRLQQTEQDIADNESALSRANRELTDAQAYIALTTKNRDEAVEAYAVRKKDREEETAAVKNAVSVLEGGSFIQESATLLSRGRGARNLVVGRGRGGHRARAGVEPCDRCVRAAILLDTRATALGSSMLHAAAEASEGLDAIDDIVQSIEGLIDNLKAEQQAEKEHKEWCEKEQSLTTKKRDDHSATIEELKAELANLAEVITEKNTDLAANTEAIASEEASWEGLTTQRNSEKEEYEHDAEEHKEAIMALNEAIDILAKFYASKKKASLLQVKPVELMSETRSEFEQSLKHIEEGEAEAEKLYTEAKAAHVQTSSDLAAEKDAITVAIQTAQAAVEQAQEDKAASEAEVASATSYLGQLTKSCAPLLEHYDERKKMRKEEKKALEDAINVLKEAA